MLALLGQSLRSWKTARSVAFLAVAALAIGIGSATGIFSVVETVLLRPLPYANADRYLNVRAEWRQHPGAWTIFSYGDFQDYASRQRTLDAIGAFHNIAFNISFRNRPMHVLGAEISPELLPMFGISPVMGQWFGPKDKDVALISEALWRKLGSDPNIVGNLLKINGAGYTVVGVMPEWFHFPPDEPNDQMWVPLNPDHDQLKFRGYHYLRCLALPKPGVSQTQARADLQRILDEIRREQPSDAGEPEVITTESMLSQVVSYIRPRLLLLMAASVALLLIACANVASVLMARSVVRRRETAVRVALGATTPQLAFQYFAEGLIVSLAAAAVGAVLAYALVRVIVSLAADAIPRAEQINADAGVLAAALCIGVIASVFFSLAPLWQAITTHPSEALNQEVRSSASAQQRRLLRLFVVAEIALAFGLVAVSGVLWEQVNGLYRVDPGFDADNLLVAHLHAPRAKYASDEAQQNYASKLLDVIGRIPGVEAVGFSNMLPLVDSGNNTAMQVEGRPQKDWSLEYAFIEQRFVSPSYFAAMKIPLISGRLLNDGDKYGDLMPIVINQSLARLKWPNENPVGSYVRLYSWLDKRFQVVGVVGDVRNYGLDEPPHPEFYFSYRENMMEALQFAIRSRISEGALTEQVRRAVESIDPEQTIFRVQTMREVIDDSVATERLQSILLGFFASAALLLSILGVYGVVAYSVRQRTTEMGTRMALGANPRDVLRMVVREGLSMSGIGIIAGAAVLFVVARLLAHYQFHMQINDVWPFTVSAVTIASFTLLACWFPAWRAASLQPMIAIRNDSGSAWQRSRLNYRQLLEPVSSILPAHRAEANESALLSNLVAAGRDAESFAEAIAAALAVLGKELLTDTALLFTHKAAGQPYRSTADPLVSIPGDAFLVRRLQRFRSPLPLTEGDLDAWQHWANTNAPERLGEIETLRASRAAIAVAVFSKAEIIAVLLLGKPPHGAYTTEEKQSMPPAAAQLGLILENGRLTDRIVEQESLRRELMVASEVQKRLFPEGWPQTSTIELAGMCMPARGVGGDYYDFLDLGSRQIGVALADVAGKGIAAALIMSVVQASLRSLADTKNGSLAALAGKMNKLLHRSTGSNSYATFFYAQVDEENHCLRYVNAGHNPPMLFRGPAWQSHNVPFVASAAPVQELTTGGTIIGMFAQSTYEEAVVELRSGDVLILFSDGVSEAYNPAEEDFGEDRLRELLRKVADLPINDMVTAVMKELKEWMQDAPQHDDLTFVLMKVR